MHERDALTGSVAARKSDRDQAGKPAVRKKFRSRACSGVPPGEPEAGRAHQDREGSPVVVVDERGEENSAGGEAHQAEEEALRAGELLQRAEDRQDERVGDAAIRKPAQGPALADDQDEIEAGEVDPVEKPERMEGCRRVSRRRRPGRERDSAPG